MTNTVSIRGGQKRNTTLDVVKGICILFIILTHCSWTEQQRLNLLFPFWIDMAVPVFMAIMGYLWSAAYTKKNISSLAEAYSWFLLRAKLSRFLLPFVVVFGLQILYFCLYKTFYRPDYCLTIGSVFHDLVYAGGWGPGSYYVPVLVQLIFIFPVLYFLVKKNVTFGFLICVCLNILFELVQVGLGLEGGLYRILAFRYLAVVALGIYLFFAGGRLKMIWQCLGFVVGVGFLVSYCYCSYRPWWQPYWATTSWLACGLIVPFVVRVVNSDWHCDLLELMGRASWHIFLVQMAYFNQCGWIVNRLTNSFGVRIMFNVLLCVSVGVGFYLVDEKIRRTL